jgi:formylglycine-generating enzyme required for sulfatase activity
MLTINRCLAAIIGMAFALAGAPALADKRVALVVGNSAYKNVTPLDNPARDARLMAETLRSLGFTLVGGAAQLDLDKAGFDGAVQSFGNRLQGAEVGLFYYAGHGVQVRGANYLVPVGANPTKEADVDFQMLDSNLVLRQMESAGTKLNIVILDACRNNPFGGRSLRGTESGLAQMRAPEGTLISFATQPGNVAQDGAAGNSPYTIALAQTLRRPGLDIFQTFNEVGLAVMQATGDSQQPWVSSSPIRGNFYFAGPATGQAPSTAATSPSTAIAAASNPDEVFWQAIKDEGSQVLFDEFLKKYPSSSRAMDARTRLDALKKQQVAVIAPPIALPSSADPCGGAAVTVSQSPRRACPLSENAERALKPKDSFKECERCPEMVVVPAGSFTMGAPESERAAVAAAYATYGIVPWSLTTNPPPSSDGPQHRVTIAQPIAVGRFPVTFDEWDDCSDDGGCNGYRPSDQGWGRGSRPAVNVSWDDAEAYVAWLSRKTGKRYRLLSEAEWEYMTRAGSMTPYWWGWSFSTSQANYNGSRTYDGQPTGENRQKTLPVASFSPNPWGFYQVHGNSYDWVEDCFHDDYVGAPVDGSSWTTGNCKGHVVRGGAWSSAPWVLRSAFRAWMPTDFRSSNHGFRMARTLAPAK